MNQPYSLRQIKAYLKQQPLLQLKGLDNIPEKNIATFLQQFFDTYNYKVATTYAGNGHIQTGAGKRRTVGDIFRITSYYFPKVTLTTVYNILFQLIKEGYVLSSICEATHTRVYRGTKNGEASYLNGDLTDEFGVDLTQFEDVKHCKSLKDKWGYTYTKEYINLISL